jgi:sulfatase maturation enzyme AslB (radical SAM superfamily)
MCHPTLSSQLLAETIEHPRLKERAGGEYRQKDFDWPKDKDFIEWCNQYLSQAIHIKLTGGEPFIIPWISSVINHIPDTQKKKCILHFVSNLTVLNDNLFECFEKFKEVWISVSVEGIKETHEYLRFGHSWSKLCDNISQIRNKKIQNLILKINHVVQAPSYHSILEMTEYFDKQEIPIHPILLTNPSHFHISALTKKAKQKFLNDTKNYQGYNYEFIKFVRSVSEEYIEQNTELTRECILHLSEFDTARNNSYEQIIPKDNLGNF